MKLSKVIKKLQEIMNEHGDLPCNVYLYKEISTVRYVDVRDVHDGMARAIKQEVFIEGDKYQDL